MLNVWYSYVFDQLPGIGGLGTQTGIKWVRSSILFSDILFNFVDWDWGVKNAMLFYNVKLQYIQRCGILNPVYPFLLKNIK